MKNNTIAIVIPCYNGWQYFSQCLASLEKQTIAPDEIVIIDDCSTDDSYFQLCEYVKTSELPITILRNEKNCGPSISRQNALLKIKSTYVCFCDCDDWYELDFIETIKKTVIENNVDLVIFDNYKIINGKREKANTTKFLINSSKKEVLANYSMSLCRMAIRVDIFKNITFPKLYHAEDGVVASQIIAAAKSFIVLNGAYYNYLYRKNSASKTKSASIVSEFLEAYDLKKKLIGDDYYNELEYIGIKDILYGAVLNACKARLKSSEIKKIIDGFLASYPTCMKNKYLNNFSKSKSFFVKAAVSHKIWICRILTSIHTFLT